MRTWGILTATLAGGAVLLDVSMAAAADAPAPVVVARYSFDAVKAGGPVADDSGHGHNLLPFGGHGGKVKLSPGAAGLAAAFPAKCKGKAKKCPHAVLQAPDAPELNPGTGPIRYGASVRLAKGQTGKGENVLQKGYSTAGSQYKLQVDGAAGRPSCVMADNVVRGIHVAQSDVSVADGQWHRLECRRAGATLTLLVDDAVRATTAIPATLAITNSVPLSVGGKGNGLNNDQFHGALDDVWIALG
ncbi:laminin G domain-containing protein [Dactylosporangium sp. NPDC051541]|uniref:laminin G domain-containing protein n=1 Tax=Dactylosporangium sp. NPDC051541 TaxID=3363977 RepID=UPI0037964C06